MKPLRHFLCMYIYVWAAVETHNIFGFVWVAELFMEVKAKPLRNYNMSVLAFCNIRAPCGIALKAAGCSPSNCQAKAQCLIVTGDFQETSCPGGCVRVASLPAGSCSGQRWGRVGPLGRGWKCWLPQSTRGLLSDPVLPSGFQTSVMEGANNG